MTQILAKIENKNGVLVVSSRVIAEQLSKRHSDVLSQLEKILENENVRSLIISSTYKVEGQKKEYKEYLLTEKGFTMYMFSIQGYEDFKLYYINEFERMKNSLNNPLSMLLNMDKEQLALTTLQLTQQIQEAKPKIEYYEKVLKSNETFTTTQVAKIFGMSAIGLNKQLELEGIQFKQRGTWLLKSKYQDKGYAKIETIPYGDNQSRKQLVWTEKGIEFINNLIEKL